MRTHIALSLLIGLFATIPLWIDTADATNPKKVVLVTIDGFRPEFYLSERFTAPTLKKLMAEGSYAENVAPVFPSLTYPNHTSLITGVHSEKHGVLSNSVFTWQGGPSPAWYWEADYVKAPTLFDLVKKAGRTSASLRWPVTLKATNITYNVPEIFSMAGFYEGDGFELTRKFTEPNLMKDILEHTTLQSYSNEVEMDFWVAEASAYILHSRQPDLLTVHLANVDHVEHGAGREGDDVITAVKDADKNIKIILDAIDFRNTCLIITGDHGFMNISKKVSPNILFAKKGWLKVENDKIKSWDVVAQASGGQAAIYIKNKRLVNEVRKLLLDNTKLGFDIIERSQLDKLGAYPEAHFAIEGKPGFTISGSTTGDIVSSSGTLKGNHGFLPTHPEIQTGLIAIGCGEKKNENLGHIEVIDVAPTIRSIMQLPASDFDGKPIL